MDLFLEHIIKPPIQEHMITAILNQVRFEREGNVINRSAVKACVEVFLTLSADSSGATVYARDLEPALLKESENYYRSEGIALIETCDAPEYLRRVSSSFLSPAIQQISSSLC